MAWGSERVVFIVVDGLDGCGKDTHALRIKALLESEGKRVVIVSHPSGRLFGRVTKRFLQESGPLARLLTTLFFTADVLVSVRDLKRERNGTTILVRYLLGTAYLPRRLAPMGYRVLRKILPFPDLAIFIDIEPEVAHRRIAARGHAPEMFETPQRLASVRRIAKTLVAQEWVTIDNSEEGERPFRDTERVLREHSLLGFTG
jgi:dTMP kinase